MLGKTSCVVLLAAVLLSESQLPAVSGIELQVVDEIREAQRLYNQGRYRLAEQEYLKILPEILEGNPSDPRLPSILNDLGAACFHLGKLDEATGYFEQALQGACQSELTATVWNNLGTVSLGRGAFGEAELHFHNALRLRESLFDPEHPMVGTVLRNLADHSCCAFSQ